ncbi:DsrE family protein [Thiomicrospira sp. ALE5]|uniref:DsrE family protein n=1 Tax=Thiomicrospira sp. ALE5 TaxID=748650 RepID=UPI0008E316D4|nr:DsrE family protein [Thiomicrospira sp. ALE5]SFR49633.1 DsrE/DsrF-like family protein [Thiomicrospira sp. ALE5]
MRTLIGFILSLALATSALAQPNNNKALEGMTQAQVVWDITNSNPGFLTVQMQVIKETYQNLKDAGLEPEMILAFHGQNVNFLTTGLETVELDQMVQVETFNKHLNKLLQLDGVKAEVCSIANRVFGVENGDIRDPLIVVGNSYVSFISLQHQGWGIIGIH